MLTNGNLAEIDEKTGEKSKNLDYLKAGYI
jgi:hypothetical protein